ncbi:MAG: hypothetical protein QGH45_14190, partial [Myxococcota bacterium]|nr:hypothetical protein [Myxococcota bacterium]
LADEVALPRAHGEGGEQDDDGQLGMSAHGSSRWRRRARSMSRCPSRPIASPGGGWATAIFVTVSGRC